MAVTVNSPTAGWVSTASGLCRSAGLGVTCRSNAEATSRLRRVFVAAETRIAIWALHLANRMKEQRPDVECRCLCRKLSLRKG